MRIALTRETIELPWASREALLEQFRHLPSMADTQKAFEDVGTSRPVVLSEQGKHDLIQVIEVWGGEVEGGLTDGLPEGVFELRNALHDDLGA